MIYIIVCLFTLLFHGVYVSFITYRICDMIPKENNIQYVSWYHNYGPHCLIRISNKKCKADIGNVKSEKMPALKLNCW